MIPFLLSAFLTSDHDKTKSLELGPKHLVVTFKGKTQVFDLEKILFIGIVKKKLIIALVMGGIGTTMSMIALSAGWYNYHANLTLAFLFFGLMYYGFIGSEALEVTEKGNSHIFLMHNPSLQLKSFMKFYNARRRVLLNNRGGTIYHLAEPGCWLSQLDSDEYLPDEFDKDGFIHTSHLEQVRETYERYYSGKEMLLLSINSNYLKEKLLYEEAPSRNESFPHIYGPLNKESVLDIFVVKSISDTPLLIDGKTGASGSISFS